MTRARDAATNSHVTTFVHPTGAGNQHVPAAGAAGQLLQYASAGTAAWATVSSGETITFPSDWLSPTTTYTSSGTWSKGALADDAYVWLYLVGGGGGGSMREYTNGTGASEGGNGGGAFLLYGQAGVLNGTTYTIAAGTAGRTSSMSGSRWDAINGNVSTFTLSSARGSTVYTTPIGASGASNNTSLYVKFISAESVLDIIPLSASSDDFVLTNTPAYEFTDFGTPTGITNLYGLALRHYTVSGAGQASVFGAGNGGSNYDNSVSNGTSQFAGDGGVNATQGAAGASPGGGGGGSQNGSNSGGAGAAGNLRQYNV